MQEAEVFMSKAPEDHMGRALELARQAAIEGEVPVGAVIVDPRTGAIVAEGYNTPIRDQDPTAHAEILAIRNAARKIQNYRLADLDLYVTLEPCTMCAGAIANARIRRVIYAAEDLKGGAVVNGVRFFDQPTCHWHPVVEQGPFADDAADLLKAFFRSRRNKPTNQIT